METANKQQPTTICGLAGCGKQLQKKQQRFCCSLHSSRFHARVRYYKLRNNPKFKKESYIRLKNWIDNNRARFNELCREPNKIRNAKKYKSNKEKGLCGCGRDRDNPRWKTCIRCREYFRKKDNKNKLNQKDVKINE